MWRNDQKDDFIEKIFDTTKSFVIISCDLQNLTFLYENYIIYYRKIQCIFHYILKRCLMLKIKEIIKMQNVFICISNLKIHTQFVFIDILSIFLFYVL